MESGEINMTMGSTYIMTVGFGGKAVQNKEGGNGGGSSITLLEINVKGGGGGHDFYWFFMKMIGGRGKF